MKLTPSFKMCVKDFSITFAPFLGLYLFFIYIGLNEEHNDPGKYFRSINSGFGVAFFCICFLSTYSYVSSLINPWIVSSEGVLVKSKYFKDKNLKWPDIGSFNFSRKKSAISLLNVNMKPCHWIYFIDKAAFEKLLNSWHQATANNPFEQNESN